MKIAYVYDLIYIFTKSGAELRFWELAKRMVVRGHDVYLIGMKFWDGPCQITVEGVHLVGICKALPLYNKKGRRSFKQIFWFSIKLFPFLSKNHFDIIDCNAFPYLPFFVVKWFSLNQKIPLVITWQEVWGKYCQKYFGRLVGSIVEMAEKFIIQSSAVIIAHANKVKENLINAGAKRESVVIIPDGVDYTRIQSAPTHYEKSDIIFVGRLVEHKNIEVLIEAVNILKFKLPDIKCLVIGKGPLETMLRTKVNSLKLEKSIVFKIAVEYDDLISYLKASKVFVFPSTREGFGIAPLEAMAAGLGVIVIRAPMNAAVELVQDGINGFACDLTAKQIAQKVGMLLGDDDLHSKISFRAREFAKNYDWDIIIEKNERLYQRLYQPRL